MKWSLAYVASIGLFSFYAFLAFCFPQIMIELQEIWSDSEFELSGLQRLALSAGDFFSRYGLLFAPGALVISLVLPFSIAVCTRNENPTNHLE